MNGCPEPPYHLAIENAESTECPHCRLQESPFVQSVGMIAERGCPEPPYHLAIENAESTECPECRFH